MKAVKNFILVSIFCLELLSPFMIGFYNMANNSRYKNHKAKQGKSSIAAITTKGSGKILDKEIGQARNDNPSNMNTDDDYSDSKTLRIKENIPTSNGEFK